MKFVSFSIGFLMILHFKTILGQNDDIESKIQNLQNLMTEIQKENKELKSEIAFIQREMKNKIKPNKVERVEIPIEIKDWNLSKTVHFNDTGVIFSAGQNIELPHKWKVYVKSNANANAGVGEFGIFLKLVETSNEIDLLDEPLAKLKTYAQISAVISDGHDQVINRIFGEILDYNSFTEETWDFRNSISINSIEKYLNSQNSTIKLNLVCDFYGLNHPVYDQWEKTLEETRIHFDVKDWNLMKQTEFRDSTLLFSMGESVNMPCDFLIYLKRNGNDLGFFLRLIKPYDNEANAILLDYTVQLLNSEGKIVETGTAGLRNYIKIPSWGFSKLIPISLIDDPDKKILSDGNLKFIIKVSFFGKRHPVYPMLPSPTEFIEVELIGDNLLKLVEPTIDPQGQGHVEIDLGIGRNFTVVPGLFWDENEENWITEWKFNVYLLNKKYLIPKIEVESSRSENSQPIMAKFQVQVVDIQGLQVVPPYVPILEDFRFGKQIVPLGHDLTLDTLKELEVKYAKDFIRFRLKLTVFGRYSTFYNDLTL